MGKVGLYKHTLVPAAGLQDLGKGQAIGFGILGSCTPRQMFLLRRDNTGGAKDPLCLLELYCIEELLLAVAANKSLDPIPVLILPEIAVSRPLYTSGKREAIQVRLVYKGGGP
jgi:hypothetical protein